MSKEMRSLKYLHERDRFFRWHQNRNSIYYLTTYSLRVQERHLFDHLQQIFDAICQHGSESPFPKPQVCFGNQEKKTCEVAVHFNREPPNLCDFSFIGIKQIHKTSDVHSDDKLLLTREAYWSAQLCRLQSYGLNKTCEFRSKTE